MKYFNNEQDLEQYKSEIKQELCPNPKCRKIGFLNCHSIIYGAYSSDNTNNDVKGQRIFCCNTGNRNGCGKTFALYYASILKHRVIQAKDIWTWLLFILKHGFCYKAMDRCSIPFSLRCKVHLLKAFIKNQSRIRSYLCRFKKPPNVQNQRNIIQTILHLNDCFSQSECAITQFQSHFQVPFFI